VDWCEDDQMWSDLAPVMFLGDDSATAEIDGITKRLVPQLPAGATVLEIPCGIGRHAREWARRGYAVTAVDRTQRYIDEGRARAAARAHSMS
jgi:2-polyprenyl-3-methyl-5-hydroxy-6-metoxy-1,4-benzoquinol methylase